jgi:hypothetical protein
MIDMRSSPPNELVRFADVMTKLMVQLPDLLPRERRQYEKTGDLGGMDDHALMHNWKRCIAGDPDAVWVDRRVPFVQTLADRLIALATDGSRAAGAVIDRLLTGIIGQARVPLVTHFQSQPVAGETADEAYARLMGDDDVDDAPPQPAQAPQPAQPPPPYVPPPEDAPTATPRGQLADTKPFPEPVAPTQAPPASTVEPEPSTVDGRFVFRPLGGNILMGVRP